MVGQGIIGRGIESGVRALPRTFGPALGGSIFSWVVFGVILLAVIGLIVWAVVHTIKKRQAALLEPLRTKFIEGKITEEEYLAKKAVILKQ